MFQIFLFLFACGEKETDSAYDPNDPSSEPSEPSGNPSPEPGEEPFEVESPDDFAGTCSEDSLGNTVTTTVDDTSYELTEAVWDIEEFGLMTVALGTAGTSSLCDRINDGSYSSEPSVSMVMTGEGGLSSNDSYSLSVDATDGDPGMEYASVSFDTGTGEIFVLGSGSIDISHYTYGDDMTLSISIDSADGQISASDISACYCPGALEIIADF